MSTHHAPDSATPDLPAADPAFPEGGIQSSGEVAAHFDEGWGLACQPVLGWLCIRADFARAPEAPGRRGPGSTPPADIATAVRHFETGRDRLTIDLAGTGLTPEDVVITHLSRFVARVDYGDARILLYGTGLDRLSRGDMTIVP